MSDTKSSRTKSWLISYGLATAVLLVGLFPEWFAKEPVGTTTEVFITIAVWFILIIQFFAISVLGIGTIAIVYFGDKFTADKLDKVNVYQDQLTTLKPKIWWSIPLTIYWLTAFVLAGWSVTGGFYLTFTILSWILVFAFSGAINNIAERLKEEK